MICYIVKKGKENKCNFSVTTNGYDIDKYLDFLKDNKIFSFQITLDGVEDVQNERKPHYKNNDSFTKITENIDALLKLGFPVAVRINTDSYTISRLDELFLFFKQKGGIATGHLLHIALYYVRTLRRIQCLKLHSLK